MLCNQGLGDGSSRQINRPNLIGDNRPNTGFVHHDNGRRIRPFLGLAIRPEGIPGSGSPEYNWNDNAQGCWENIAWTLTAETSEAHAQRPFPPVKSRKSLKGRGRAIRNGGRLIQPWEFPHPSQMRGNRERVPGCVNTRGNPLGSIDRSLLESSI